MDKPNSIRRTLMIWLVVGPGIILASATWLVVRRTDTLVQARFDRELMTRAETFATLTQVENGEIDLSFADELMLEYEHPEGPAYFEIWLPEGFLLERSYSLENQSLKAWVPEGLSSPSFVDVSINGTLCRVAVLQFIPENEDLDLDAQLHPADQQLAVTAMVALRRDGLDQDLRRLHGIIASAIGGAFLLLLAFSFWLVTKGLSPLTAIAQRVAQLNPAKLDRSLKVARVPAELVVVVDQINALLERIDHTMKRERQFTSDVAHELRTPIAEMRSLMEVGLRFKDDHEYLQSVAADAELSAIQLQHIVDCLLRLTRSDSGTEQARMAVLPLAPLVERVVLACSDVATRRGMSMKANIDPDVSVVADHDLLQLVLTNLIGNAVAYADEGTEVGIRCESDPTATRLIIENQTSDLDQADLPHMFERFWRKDIARSGGEHSGLGLALVSAYTDLMRMDMKVRLNEPIFTVTLMFTALEESQG
ncbi:MAG: sensor histidine kinase N-terminal domain-containing protein [Acidobacteria bacterium]|nr:sensor histidine kinase N-terminal domain-containing protein [Acidobacteriota bacterium]